MNSATGLAEMEGEDDVFQHGAHQGPGIGVATRPDPAQPVPQRSWRPAMLCLKMRIIHMFVRPGGQPLAILVNDIVG